MKNYWNKNDNTSKDYLNVMAPDGNGGYIPVSISTVQVGQPCFLQLPNGDIIRTSKVHSWTIIGGARINTENRTYYALDI